MLRPRPLSRKTKFLDVNTQRPNKSGSSPEIITDQMLNDEMIKTSQAKTSEHVHELQKNTKQEFEPTPQPAAIPRSDASHLRERILAIANGVFLQLACLLSTQNFFKRDKFKFPAIGNHIACRRHFNNFISVCTFSHHAQAG